MAYLRISDDIEDHPAFVVLSARAFMVWVFAGAWCQRHLTDGVIPEEVILNLRGCGRQTFNELIEKERLSKCEGGYLLVGHTKHNDSRELIVSRRKKKAEQMARLRGGGATKPHVVSSVVPPLDSHVTSTVPNLIDTKNVSKERENGAYAPAPLVEPFALFALWNEITTPPIARGREFSAGRRRHAAKRLEERPVGAWREVFERIERSRFCRGENQRGWVASFDWIIGGPEPAIKVLEGKYDDRAGAVKAAEQEPRRRSTDDWGECLEMHNGSCGSGSAHRLWRQIDAEKVNV